MKSLLAIAMLLTLSTSLSAQVVIEGVVIDRATQKALAGANVTLHPVGEKRFVAYAITANNGTFSLKYSGELDKFLLRVRGISIETKEIEIDGRSQRIDIVVDAAEVQIKEVSVKPVDISRKGDTLSYNIASYIDVTDRTIGDVLKKLPGIKVAESGQINYNGRPISRFMIEGLDMLEGKYGVATNNILAKDIASAQVLENHSNIQALKDIEYSNQAALNLTLKETARGAWNVAALLGGGYKPAMWEAEVVPMYFSRSFQTLNTYKTNNSGNDVSRDVRSFYNILSGGPSLTSIRKPSLPPISRERYLDNNIHLVSANTITKLKKGYELVVNAHYLNDRQKARGWYSETHHLPQESAISIIEDVSATQLKEETELSLQLNTNTPKVYLKERLTFYGSWNRDRGGVVNGDEKIGQRKKQPRFTVRNIFESTKRWGQWVLRLNSNTYYTRQESSLLVAPNIYPNIFENATDYPNIKQNLDNNIFSTSNLVGTDYKHRRWVFSLKAKLNFQTEQMNSELFPQNDIGERRKPVEQMKNDMRWSKSELGPQLGVSYRIGELFSLSLNLPLEWNYVSMKDRVGKRNDSQSKFFFAPTITLDGKIHTNLSYSANVRFQKNTTGLADSYSGYIMADYRTFSSRISEIGENEGALYSGSLSYSNAFLSLFGSLEASYRTQKRDLTYNTIYDGTMSQIEVHRIDNRASDYNFEGSLSKGFPSIRTTLHLSGGYYGGKRESLRQGELVSSRHNTLFGDFSIEATPVQYFNLGYSANLEREKSRVEKLGDLEPILTFTQSLGINFIVKQRLRFNLSAEHYYNDAISGSDKNIYFLNALVSYTTKRIEYQLIGNNLLNTRNFKSVSYDDISSYSYSYRLRPLSVMFKVRFSLR